MRTRWRSVLTVLTAVAAAGCSSIGPGTIKRDRTDYSGAMASSWKEQMVLNIVKFRYFDPPVFLDVSSIVSSQELQTRANVTSRLLPHPLSSAQDFYEMGASGRYTDRPTISYTPLTGERFINNLLRPIPPQTIFAMIEAGHDANFIFQLSVRAINGIFGASSSPARARVEDPAFRRVTSVLRRLQQAGAIGMRTEIERAGGTSRRGETQRATSRTGEARRAAGRQTEESGTVNAAWVFFRHGGSAAVEQDIRLVKTMLGLAPSRDEFLLVFGSRRSPDELALLTRSMQEIMTELAAGVEVPEEDVAQGRATPPSPLDSDAEPRASALIQVHSSSERPIGAYTAVSYRDRWFWVDDRDLRSKRVFMFLMMFSALSETRAVPQVPVVTIPANR